jgi:hypothetical protein
MFGNGDSERSEADSIGDVLPLERLRRLPLFKPGDAKAGATAAEGSGETAPSTWKEG